MEVNLMELESRHAHDLLTSAIIPRPIAWVSSVNRHGQANLAPFSFFTGVSWSPPVLAFSVVNRSDGTLKDTARNIREVPEFVVNFVSVPLLSTMEYSAKPIPYGTDETSIAGIHWLPSKRQPILRRAFGYRKRNKVNIRPLRGRIFTLRHSGSPNP
jgi:flavin reductase (DIM6/NTAB) family NADH-FMN oxidoreductase RutF